jgi:UDP-glucose 4-epimerase
LENLLLRKKHEILCFDMRNPRNEKEMERLSRIGEFQTFWGDITDPDIVAQAVEGQGCILHLAAIIPPLTEQSPDLAHRVNVEGTHNVIEAAKQQEKSPKMVFTSSISVHGNRFSEPLPRRADEPPQPTDNYTHSKVASEKESMESGIDWTILRVGAAAPVNVLGSDSLGLGSLEYSFGIPLEQRMEVVHPVDVATAIANSVEADTAGKIPLLGGGKSCQMTNRHFQTKLFEALGIGMVCEKAFRVPKDESDYWYTDFMDTEESQRLLKFQHHTFDHYIDDLKRAFGWRRIFTSAFSPIIRRWLMRYSPYYKTS